MATRPVVLVFQEFSTLSTSSAAPELNVCVTGPAYHIQDFPEDRASIKLTSNYGTKDGASPYAAPLANTNAITVADVPNNKVGAKLDRASVRAFLGTARAQLAAGVDGASTAQSAVLTSASGNFVTAGVKTGDHVIVGSTVGRVRTVTATTLTLTNEFTATASGLSYRVEREVTDVEVASSFIETVPGSNEVRIKGGMTVTVDGAAKQVNYAEVHLAYRSLRQDLQDLKTLSGVTAVRGQLGRIDARNPLAVGVFVALQNTNTSVQYYGVASDDLTGYNAMKSAIGGRKDIYAVVPLTTDINVIASFKSEFESLADVDYALENGVPQKFRVVIGSAGELPDTKIVVDANTDGQVQAYAGSAPAASTHTVSFATGVNLITLGVKPGYLIELDLDGVGGGASAVYTVAHVNSATALEVVEDGLSTGTHAAATVIITTAAGIEVQGSTATEVTIAADGDLSLDLRDANGTFLDDGVVVGDLLEMNADLAAAGFGAADRFEIAAILSNQHLRIKNNGRNTALVVNELPHGASRSGTVAAVPTSGSLTYRVVRALDLDGQVAELEAVPESIASRRAVLCWPDLVDVADLVDGSLPRSSETPEVAVAAASQPGYYLACAVGGMTAALPSHQGFTNLGIAGIEKLYHSNTHFEDRHITKISNAGWMVFQQDNPEALPYIVHQLTTDPSTLQFGEFSMVKNLDYVSIDLADIVDDFIGPWNINKETLGFVQAAVQAGLDNLKLRKRPRIGAPINDGRITSLGESTVAADRLELEVECDFPKPLNTVGLHIVSK